jgi:hypothetical protein
VFLEDFDPIFPGRGGKKARVLIFRTSFPENHVFQKKYFHIFKKYFSKNHASWQPRVLFDVLVLEGSTLFPALEKIRWLHPNELWKCAGILQKLHKCQNLYIHAREYHEISFVGSRELPGSHKLSGSHSFPLHSALLKRRCLGILLLSVKK